MRLEEVTSRTDIKELSIDDLLDLRSRALQIYQKYFEGGRSSRDAPLDYSTLIGSYDLIWQEIESRGRIVDVSSLEQACMKHRFKKWKDSPEKRLDIRFPGFVLIDKFLSLSGSVVWAQDREPNDVDCIIAAERDSDGNLVVKLGSDFFLKLKRILQSRYPDMAIHWVDNPQGPNWKHLPLAQLTIRPYPNPEIRDVGEPEFAREFYKSQVGPVKRAEDTKWKWGAFRVPSKPVRCSEPHERMVLDHLGNFIKNGDYPVFAQKKFDGIHALVHAKPKEVIIYTEEGEKVKESRIPHVFKAIRKFMSSNKLDSAIFDGELVAWKDDIHQPREAVAGYLHREESIPSGLDFHLVVFGLFLLNGEELLAEPQIRRKEELDEMDWDSIVLGKPTKPFSLTRTFVVNNEAELKAAAEKVNEARGSEGVVVKKGKSTYPRSGTDFQGWLKYHKNVVIQGKILEKNSTKTEGVWTYEYGCKPTDDYTGKKVGELAYIGTSGAIGIDMNEGDIIIIEAETFNVVRDNEGNITHVSAWVPRVIGQNKERIEPNNLREIISEARKEGVLQEKVQLDDQVIYKARDAYLRYPSISQSRYVLQNHYRGRSVHGDLRFELSREELVGWTLEYQIADIIEDPVETMVDAEDVPLDEAFKINLETGFFKERRTRGGDVRRASIRVSRKKPEPLEWLEFEGVVPPKEVDPEAAGGTKEYPGVFHRVDSGQVFFGAQKPLFHEYFLDGDLFDPSEGNSRILMRMISHKEKVLAPGKEEELPQEPYFWICMQPKDQTPYVLDKDAVEKEWVPPKGVSCLPPWIEEKVPSDLRFWEISGNLPRHEKRVALIKYFEEKEIDISKAEEEVEFALFRRWWRGPHIIRFGPSEQVFDWVFDLDNRLRLLLDQNPLDNEQVAGFPEGNDIDYSEFGEEPAELSPESVLNPTKDTPAYIERLEAGEAVFFEDSTQVKKFRIEEGPLEGVWLMNRESGEEFWSIRKTTPGPVEKLDLERFRSEGIDRDLSQPEKYWRQLLADLRYLGNSGYPTLKMGKEWGDWTLDDLLRYFAACVDALRSVHFPLRPPGPGEDAYDSSYWQCYREAEKYIESEPPPVEEEAEWDQKRSEEIEKMFTTQAKVVKEIEKPPELKGSLWFRAQIDKGDKWADRSWEWVLNGYLCGASWSGFPTEVEEYRKPDAFYAIVRDLDLRDISLTTLPGDEHTWLRVVDEGQRIIEGTITSEELNYLQEFVLPEAFEFEVKRYMEESPGGTIFLNHDLDKPIGRFLELQVKEELVEPGSLRRKLEKKLEKSEEGRERLRILKMDEEKHVLGAVVYAPNELDSQGDYAEREDIFEFMKSFMTGSQDVDVMHDRKHHPGIHLLESFQAESQTPMGRGFVPAGAWYVSVWIDVEKEPEVWAKVKNAFLEEGERLQGFSLEGEYDREA